MDNNSSAADIIRKILTTGSYSAEELDHIYRYLSKQTHPDLTGSNGEAFIKLQETYLKARTQAENGPRQAVFDPYLLIREAGFSEKLPDRESLYTVLKRFFQSGLHNRKLRTNPASLRRAGEILRSLKYWSDIYSPTLTGIIDTYLEKSASFMSTTKQFRDYAFGRKLFIQGTDLFFRYQATGRDTTRSLAEEKLSLSVIVLSKTTNSFHPTVLFCRWFLEELKKPPVLLEGL